MVITEKKIKFIGNIKNQKLSGAKYKKMWKRHLHHSKNKGLK